MIIRKEIDINAPLTKEQKKMLEELKLRQIQPDEDSPELTEEQLSRMMRVSEIKNKHTEQTITLHLSEQALRTAESFGKEYKSVLSRILENALADKEGIKRYL